ncbi:P-loop containing nucleoside triphosphate hydrolase protein, partial [Cladochytrium replicatum]
MPTPDTFFGGSASAIPGATARKEYQAFTFDHVYNDDASQDDLFECTRPLIEKFLNGFNATVLAYGQTGSGKTFTMGSAETSSAMTLPSTDSSLRAKLGIIPRAARYIFETLNRNRRLSDDPTANLYMTYAVKISFLELYNEDLLPEWNGSFAAKNAVQRKKPKSTGSHGEKGIMIRDAKDGSIYVAGLEEKACTTVDDVLKYLNKGSTLRRTSSTVMNEQSSRSHAILTLHLYQQKHYVPLTVDVTHMPEARHIVRTVTSLSKFHFVDLAGSERLKRTNATGDRQKEGISINGGLLALGKVISALADRDMAAPNHEKEEVHIPYRNSKLTRILKDSLGGNSQTLMIACVSPAHDDLFETLSTLRYAARARQIKNNVKSN